MLELLIGHDDALRFFAGEALGGGRKAGPVFALPKDTIGAKST
jgi:hypothetical protein